MTVLLLCVVALVLLALVPDPRRDRLSRACPATEFHGIGRSRWWAPETAPRTGAETARWAPGRFGDPLRPWVRALVRRIIRALAHRREGSRRRRAVVVLCRILAAELRAGQPPDEALRMSAAQAGPSVAGLRDAASMRAAADRDPDLWALAYLAACWEVCAETGAGLAGVVDALAEELTAHEEQRSEVAARTAGPRTTAIVLGGLPLVGLLMSAGLGGSPLVFLFTTPVGLGCLVGGAALDLLGAWWTLRMVRGAVDAGEERSRGSPPPRGPAARPGVPATPARAGPAWSGSVAGRTRMRRNPREGDPT